MMFNDCSYSGEGQPLPPGRHGRQGEQCTLGGVLYPDLRHEGESDELEILSVSLSAMGVTMELPREVQAGDFYKIVILLGEHALRSRVRITGCSSAGGGHYRAEGELLQLPA